MSFKTSKHQIKAYYNNMNGTEGGQPANPLLSSTGETRMKMGACGRLTAGGGGVSKGAAL